MLFIKSLRALAISVTKQLQLLLQSTVLSWGAKQKIDKLLKMVCILNYSM